MASFRSTPIPSFLVEPREHDLLSHREETVLLFVGAGRSNKEIARELGVTPETVKTHLKRIFSKLSAGTRAQAVARATSLGLMRFGDGEGLQLWSFPSAAGEVVGALAVEDGNGRGTA